MKQNVVRYERCAVVPKAKQIKASSVWLLVWTTIKWHFSAQYLCELCEAIPSRINLCRTLLVLHNNYSSSTPSTSSYNDATCMFKRTFALQSTFFNTSGCRASIESYTHNQLLILKILHWQKHIKIALICWEARFCKSHKFLTRIQLYLYGIYTYIGKIAYCNDSEPWSYCVPSWSVAVI